MEGGFGNRGRIAEGNGRSLPRLIISTMFAVGQSLTQAWSLPSFVSGQQAEARRLRGGAWTWTGNLGLVRAVPWLPRGLPT